MVQTCTFFDFFLHSSRQRSINYSTIVTVGAFAKLIMQSDKFVSCVSIALGKKGNNVAPCVGTHAWT